MDDVAFLHVCLKKNINSPKSEGYSMTRPEEAIERLKDGNARFAEGRQLHPNLGEERRHETYHRGQNPFAAILSCADSRGPVEMIFDQGLGDIFSIRNAGNTCGPNVIGSLEIGVYKLHIPLLVVLGHTDCGAINLSFDKTEISGYVSDIINHIAPLIESVKQQHSHRKREDIIIEVAKANARLGVNDILERSDIIRQRVNSGRLKVLPALHCLKSGCVEWFE